VNEESIELDRRPGRIEVSPTAIAMAASRVVLECYGVSASRTVSSDTQGRDPRRSNYQRGINVAIQGEQVVVDVYIVVEYGTKNPRWPTIS